MIYASFFKKWIAERKTLLRIRAIESPETVAVPVGPSLANVFDGAAAAECAR
jgi:hypothetical protein